MPRMGPCRSLGPLAAGLGAAPLLMLLSAPFSPALANEPASSLPLPPEEAVAAPASPPPAQEHMSKVPEPERATYGKQHREGRKLYDQGNYQGALQAFTAAYGSSGRAVILYDIGLAFRALGKKEDATDAFQAFLVSAKRPPPALHEAARRHISEIDELRSAVVTDSVPQASPATPVAPKKPLFDFDFKLSPKRWHIAAAVTVVLGVGTVIAGLAARSRYNELLESCGTFVLGCPPEQIDGVETRILITNLFLAGTAIAAAGTGALFYFDVRKDRKEAGLAWVF